MVELPVATVDELTAGLDGQAYLADRGLSTAIYLSLSLGKPLLLEDLRKIFFLLVQLSPRSRLAGLGLRGGCQKYSERTCPGKLGRAAHIKRCTSGRP